MNSKNETIPLIIMNELQNHKLQENKKNTVDNDEEKVNKYIKYFGITILILLTISFIIIVIIQSLK
jgi:hypothetical protein